MVQAKELISNIDKSIGIYKTQNNTKSKQIKNEIMTKKSEMNTKSLKTAKNYTALKTQLSTLGNGKNTEVSVITINLKASLTKQKTEIQDEIKTLKEENNLLNTEWNKVTIKNLEDYQTYASEQVKIAEKAKEITTKLEKAAKEAGAGAVAGAAAGASLAAAAAAGEAKAAITAAETAETATNAAADATAAETAITAKPTAIIDTIDKIESAITALDELINKIVKK